MIGLGCQVIVQKGAGTRVSVTDAAYQAAGAEIVSAEEVFKADIILQVRAPEGGEIKAMQAGSVLIGLLEPYNLPQLNAIAHQGITAFSLEAMTRNSRAQGMDVLSSQANVAGYKAVSLGSHFYQRFMPMLMTSVGESRAGIYSWGRCCKLKSHCNRQTVRCSGRGIRCTAGGKRTNRVTWAKFLDVSYESIEEKEIAEGIGGYECPMTASWMTRQAAFVAQRPQNPTL